MKTITLTKEEIEILKIYLECNPCEVNCVFNYKTDMCNLFNYSGNPLCKLLANKETILEKLEGGENNSRAKKT